ncbi:hypothetical protein EON67_08785 [archaeon]|nr:MAG: hypothetical protein EON67_08785 [archaeon]
MRPQSNVSRAATLPRARLRTRTHACTPSPPWSPVLSGGGGTRDLANTAAHPIPSHPRVNRCTHAGTHAGRARHQCMATPRTC